MTTALILFAHGARDPEWASPMRRVQTQIRERLAAASRGTPVELAFLEFMAPTLADCCAGLIAQGAKKVVVVPMFIARGGHLKREVPEMLAQLRSTYPAVEFALSDPIGEQEAVIQTMAASALEIAGL